MIKVNDTIKKYSDSFLIETYNYVTMFEPHSVSYIRQMQEEMRVRGIDIPARGAGYRNELGKMEHHPDKEINEGYLSVYRRGWHE